MKKTKKPIIAQVEEDQSEENDSDFGSDSINSSNEEVYDSMIENGTSEDSSDNDDDAEEESSQNKKQHLIRLETNKSSTIQNTEETNKTKRKRNQENDDIEKTSKKFKSTRHLYKPPTVEEMNQLRETENLFHSNLFRMQINEMLKEVKIKEKYKKFVQEWLNNFNEFLKDLKSMKEKENSTNLSWLQDAEINYIPLDMSAVEKEKSFRFQFLKPISDSFIIGSFQTETIIGSLMMIDICVLMPSKCFEKEDYLNLIYDKKRALYLSYIAWKMKQKMSENFNEIKFNYHRNNPYKTVLEIEPNGKIGQKLNFRIFVCPEEDSFKLNRFVPWNSNIRGSLFGEYYENPDDEPLLATPNYNATVLCDLTMKTNQEFLKDLLCDHKNLREGLILLKIWLKQRNLDSGYSGFGSFLMSMWVAYLFKTKKLHTAMSSYQIARNTWNHLALSAWNEDGKGISLCDDLSKSNQPTLEQFHVYYDVVFIDTTGFLNLCANLSLDLYMKIKYEAQQAIELLNNKNVNSFQMLFMTKIPIFTNYDYILKICNTKSILIAVNKYCEKSDRYNYAGMWYPLLLKNITSVLRKGLADRIICMAPIEISSEPWKFGEKPKKMRKSFYLGFILNHERAFEILDKGPQANDETAAEEFRKFWGKKAKLRRFQDASIVEACVWASSDEILSQKRNIVQRIISYLINHNLKIFYTKLEYFGTEFNSLYELNKSFYLFDDQQLIDAETTTLKVIRSFDELGKNLRELNDLPLDVSSVQGISTVFRYCDPIPTLNNGKTHFEGDKIVFQSYKIIDAVIQLGSSGKWPEELAAFRRIKTAFHLKIAEQLRKKYKYETRGSIEGVYILKDGYVFRIEIAHQKELILTKKQIVDKRITQFIETPTSITLEKRFNVIPKITSALHGLYQRYTSFGPAVMIAKRWLYSQLIDSYLWPDECTELLIASLYLNAGVYQNPFQPQTGFVRFLNLLANTDWRNEMILLNFNDEITREEAIEIESRVNNERDTFPPLIIITSYDTKRIGMWSENAPSIQILARVVVLARHALKIIETKYLQVPSIKIQDLFVPNLDGYDAVIYLRTNLLHTCLAPTDFEIIENTTEGCDNKIDATVPAAGFDPVERGLNELREAYSDFAVFFYNPCGGRQICIIWKPDIFNEKDFKVTSVNGCQPTDNGKLKCNREQLLEDFKIILSGLSYSIEDRRSKTYKPKLNEEKSEKSKKLQNHIKSNKFSMRLKSKNLVNISKNRSHSNFGKFRKNNSHFQKNLIRNKNYVKVN